MDLCDACNGLLRFVYTQLHSRVRLDPTSSYDFGNADSFLGRSGSCRLCYLIYRHIQHAFDGNPQFCSDFDQFQVRIRRSELNLSALGEIDLCITEEFEDDYDTPRQLKTAIWANRSRRSIATLPTLPTAPGSRPLGWRLESNRIPDTPAAASGFISTTPLLSTDGDLEASALFNTWIGNCRRTHRACTATLTGAIIDENDALPKTFQGAITITRQVGIRYLWIDRLSRQAHGHIPAKNLFSE
ncbi:hypothetical protein B0T24DRAFT_417282 [Lasiosphaeria ovina]|uniref:Heterokaryon incompatibility domain-containing protein n=1 Tax=Lasiosphaeria ovina TaxID=92902 RepID=A0AAE0N1S9_9PEZI|nr:hypothetical protein B0T24DRAFT_417282 [Lasiosphaeria ovina]